jgi:hypothetical protein
LEREKQDEDGRSWKVELTLDDVSVRDNRDVFDDRTAQLLTAGEIAEVRNTLTSKVDL